MGLASGFLAALAYLMIARAGRSNSPRTVVFHFSLVALLVHGVWFAGWGFQLPEGRVAWSCVLAAGVAGTAARVLPDARLSVGAGRAGQRGRGTRPR